jgi:hypothetical protein
VVAVNLARIAILSLISKALAPKIDLTQAATDKLLTIRSSVQPQAFVYGEDMLSGPLLFANTAGTDNNDLHRLIALTGREIDSFVGFRIDDTTIMIGVDIASDSGPVTGGLFADVVEIDTRTGTQSQTAIAELVSAFAGNWTSAHQGKGWALLYTKMTLTEGSEAFEAGVPQNIRAIVKGNKIYDPREVGHDIDDPDTWEWSDNPALILADFLRWFDVGYGEVADRIDWDLVEAAADVCDELETVPDGSDETSQKRYTCNFTFYADQPRQDIREIIVNSMLGRCIFTQGQWRMWAGAAMPATVTLTEANLAGSIQLQASTPSENRYNRVRGKFVDPTRNYTANPYPEQRDSGYETADNEVKYQTLDQNACNDSYEAQRNAIIKLRQSRLQRVLTFQGNWSCFRVQTGTTVLISIAELGFVDAKYFVTEWTLDKEGKGINLTMVQEDDDVWDGPFDYVTRTATGDLDFESQPDPEIPEPTEPSQMVCVASGGTNRVQSSPDGTLWTGRSASNTSNWIDVTYGGGVFVAVADGTTASMRIMRSTTYGTTWADVTEPTTGNRTFQRIWTLPSGRMVVGVNAGGSLSQDNFLTSDDNGASFTVRSTTGLTSNFQTKQFAYGNGILLAGGAYSADNNYMTSVDEGDTWTGVHETDTGSEPMDCVAYAPWLGGFVAVLGFGGVYFSAEGDNADWTQLVGPGTFASSSTFYMYADSTNNFIYVAHTLGVSRSADGVTWTNVVGGGSFGFRRVMKASSGKYVALRNASSDTAVWLSANGTTWVPQPTVSNNWLSIATT